MTDAEALAAEIRRHVYAMRNETGDSDSAYRSWYHVSWPGADLPEALAADLVAAGWYDGKTHGTYAEGYSDASVAVGGLWSIDRDALRARVAELEAEQARFAGVSLFSPILGEIRGRSFYAIGANEADATGAEVSE